MKKVTFACAVLAAGILFFFTNTFTFPDSGGLTVVPVAYAQNWKNEFDDLCSKTQDAMMLTDDELKSLVDRCDKLKVLIENLDEVQKKVYLKRLVMCRDLFEYVLKSRQKK